MPNGNLIRYQSLSYAYGRPRTCAHPYTLGLICPSVAKSVPRVSVPLNLSTEDDHDSRSIVEDGCLRAPRGKGGRCGEGVGRGSTQLRAPRWPSTSQARWPEFDHLIGGFEGRQGSPQLGRDPLFFFPCFLIEKWEKRGGGLDPAWASLVDPRSLRRDGRTQATLLRGSRAGGEPLVGVRILPTPPKTIWAKISKMKNCRPQSHAPPPIRPLSPWPPISNLSCTQGSSDLELCAFLAEGNQGRRKPELVVNLRRKLNPFLVAE
ncbi:hypothetical protein CRG98_034491 [Punica granatum]|uniref:Uncharacterized protein n=1 Tax=Punica granatum TaxID=22663 RepID=A0A2I0IM66_PUNGR|nr:hypothetical protein CRG98_034491 [Punica granatum]